MTSAEFIYQLGFDAGAESRDEEVVKAHFEGEKELAKRLVKTWGLDTISDATDIDNINELIAAILASAGAVGAASELLKEK